MTTIWDLKEELRQIIKNNIDIICRSTNRNDKYKLFFMSLKSGDLRLFNDDFRGNLNDFFNFSDTEYQESLKRLKNTKNQTDSFLESFSLRLLNSEFNKANNDLSIRENSLCIYKVKSRSTFSKIDFGSSFLFNKNIKLFESISNDINNDDRFREMTIYQLINNINKLISLNIIEKNRYKYFYKIKKDNELNFPTYIPCPIIDRMIHIHSGNLTQRYNGIYVSFIDYESISNLISDIIKFEIINKIRTNNWILSCPIITLLKNHGVNILQTENQKFFDCDFFMIDKKILSIGKKDMYINDNIKNIIKNMETFEVYQFDDPSEIIILRNN